MHYNILIATTSNSSRAKVVAKTNDTRFDLSTLEIEAGTYYVWVSFIEICRIVDIIFDIIQYSLNEAHYLIYRYRQ